MEVRRSATAPFADGYNPSQPCGKNGRWISSGSRLLAALGFAGSNQIEHVEFASVKRPGELKKLIGHDVKGFKHSASNQSMRHALKQHSNAAIEKSRGQKPLTSKDFSLLPKIVGKGVYKAAQQRDFGPRRVEIHAELNGDKYTYVAEARAGKRRLDMVTMWKK